MYLKSFPNRFNFYIKNYWWKFLIVFAVILADMLTKFLLVPLDSANNVDNSKVSPQSLIGDVLWLYPSTNSGAGFSILDGKTILLVVISIIFILGLVCFDFAKPQKSKLYNCSIALIFSGAIGNLIDRLAFGGKVRDFLYFKFINFPIFNVADMALTFGIACILIWIIFFHNKNNDLKKNLEEHAQNEDDNL